MQSTIFILKHVIGLWLAIYPETIVYMVCFALNKPTTEMLSEVLHVTAKVMKPESAPYKHG